jgi:ribosomal protein L18E
MATMTYDTGALANAAKPAAPAKPARKGFWRRLIDAMQESRRRQAEIEIRRVRALMADTDPGFKHALLPFRGE